MRKVANVTSGTIACKLFLASEMVCYCDHIKEEINARDQEVIIDLCCDNIRQYSSQFGGQPRLALIDIFCLS